MSLAVYAPFLPPRPDKVVTAACRLCSFIPSPARHLLPEKEDGGTSTTSEDINSESSRRHQRDACTPLLNPGVSLAFGHGGGDLVINSAPAGVASFSVDKINHAYNHEET